LTCSTRNTLKPVRTNGLPALFATGFLVLGLFGGDAVHSQAITLTPQQEAMLNQLPPSQRQQALDAIEELNRQRAGQDGDAGSALPGMPFPGLADQAMLDRLFLEEEEEEEEPTAEGGSRLVITLTPRDDLNADEREMLRSDPALERVSGSNYYELDESGVLMLPGLPTIPLLGLTEESIGERLSAEPALRVFDVAVSLIAVESAAAQALEPFGYDVFEKSEEESYLYGYGLDPVTSGPVPPDYVLGPGDTIRVQLFGNINGIYEFEVSRDGVLNLPELGPITVAGLPFSEFREDLNRRVEQMLIGTQVSVTMGELRTIRVFVLGDAIRPGSYVVSSLATISSALYESGGISEIGSLRKIQLKRNGKIVANLDLYDLLIKGDTSGDERLQPGDVILIPPIGPTVGVGGAVRRPAIYELRGESSVSEAIGLAGGLKPVAFPAASRIERIDSSDRRTVISLDVESAAGRGTRVTDGDTIFVPEVLAKLEGSVKLAGHVHRPGAYQFRPGMRLADLLPSADYLMPGADMGYILVRRENDRNLATVVSANLASAWANPGSSENIQLQARDTVHVFSLAFSRQRVIQPLLEELQLQSRVGEPYREVSVSGSVKAPGVYPLEPGMRISDLLRAGGNLSEEAYTLRAELARYVVVDDEYREGEVIDVDLDAILRGELSADLILAEHDNLRISSIPQWDTLWSVTLEGEIRFPGEYRIRRGETLREVLQRAGGLTDAAFAEGAIFLRDALREREQEQIDALSRRMEADLTQLSLETLDTTGAQALETGQSLLEQLRQMKAVGRLVIDLDQLAARAGGMELVNDVELRDGDHLMVPKQAQEVTVIGETQQNTSHLYQPGLTRDDYIDMSGGLTRRADKKLIYVVRASGSVVVGNRSRWFGRSGNSEIRPGDTIVVPLDTDRIRPLTFWTNVTQILYQGSIAIAAIRSFDN
jgi:protein involved in polysaccharide export with SLBB domain